MYPVLFEIGGWKITSYGMMAALAFLMASWIFGLNRKHARLTEDQATVIVILGVLGGIVGARIFYVIQFYDQFRYRSWFEMFKIWQGGLVFLGGFILGMILLIAYCRSRRLRLLPVFDAAAPAVALAHAFGRVGCFLNGCCWSAVSCDAWFGVSYPAFSDAARSTGGIAVHPVQLYEALFNLLIFPPLFLLARKARVGFTVAAYLMLYGVWRFTIEYIRKEPVYWIFSAAQWIGLGMVLGGAVLLVLSWRRRPEPEPVTEEESSRV